MCWKSFAMSKLILPRIILKSIRREKQHKVPEMSIRNRSFCVCIQKSHHGNSIVFIWWKPRIFKRCQYFTLLQSTRLAQTERSISTKNGWFLLLHQGQKLFPTKRLWKYVTFSAAHKLVSISSWQFSPSICNFKIFQIYLAITIPIQLLKEPPSCKKVQLKIGRNVFFSDNAYAKEPDGSQECIRT